MVGPTALNRYIGVRIPAGQPEVSEANEGPELVEG